MSIYTKNGDQGFTSTLGGNRQSKAADLVLALGDVDELNSVLGILLCYLKAAEKKVDFRSKIQAQQMNLMKLGTMLALSNTKDLRENFPSLASTDVKSLEQDIDNWVAELPELKNFILPGGNRLAAYTHHARSVCRRAERAIVKYHENVEQVEVILQYINRLSDWLFVLARKLNDGEDIVWEGAE